ncbi:MAG: thiamine phosphate synthase [Sphingobacteriales bacterium]|nr:MAG: thiamine phosphate synthase [Sphingobacteriales bacterium]TAF80761.1 MAG: thiamine phosphate synthase [Sphingobacteriales bacterium]
MKKFIGKFHYLTQDLPTFSHTQQANMACKAGANWIQYRCFSKTEAEMMNDLNQIIPICDDWGTTLIITSHFKLLNYADIQGVHVEEPGVDIPMIRKHIGNNKTLGTSANTLKEIIAHTKSGVDYIGCGPFAHTDTKPNTHTHWGINGYKNAIAELQLLNIHIPLVAAGGVTLNDIDALLQTGIYGIAVSAAVNKALDAKTAFKDIYNRIY